MTKPSGMPAERREHPSVITPVGAHGSGRSRIRRDLFTAPSEPEYRPERPVSRAWAPSTPAEWEAAIDEWRRNDPEHRSVVAAEERSRIFGKGDR